MNQLLGTFNALYKRVVKNLVYSLMVTFVASALLTGCGFQKDNLRTRGNAACSTEIFAPNEAFRRTLHPVVALKCAGCHGANPTAPFGFANTTPDLAYADAKSVVNFLSIGDSPIVTQVEKNNHNCGSADTCKSLGTEFRTQIKAWWDKGQNPNAAACVANVGGSGGSSDTGVTDKPAGSPPTYWTSPLSVAANISNAADTLLTYDLGTINPNLAGSHLRLAVRRVVPASSASPGTFRITSIIFASSTIKREIANIQFRLNGHDTSYLNYVGVRFTVAPLAYTPTATTWPFTRISLTVQDMVYESTTADSISVGFDAGPTDKAPSPDPGAAPPADQVLFNTQVAPILSRNCATCHGTNRRFDLSGSIDQDRLSALGFVTARNPTGSQLYSKGIGQNHSGGNSLPLDADRTIIMNWINSL